MRIATSLVLIAVGAILAFAVTDMIQAVDLRMVGYILMGVGTLGLIISLVLASGGRDDERPVRDPNRPPRY